MITVFTGTPGSGKTYRCVFDAFKERKKYHIVHNIDGLQDSKFPSCVHVDTLGGMEECFDYDWWLHYCRCIKEKTGLRVLLIIDECYRYFDRAFTPQMELLASHRHAGMDIWLIAQDIQMIALQYRKVIEIEIRCKSGHLFKIPGMFLYSHRSAKQDFSFSIRFARSHIYRLYKSAFIQGASKGSLLIPLALLILIPVAYFGFFYNPIPGGSNSTQDSVSGVSVSGVAQAAEIPKETAPVASDERKTAYMGPEIIGHQGNIIAYKGPDGRPLFLTVREFVHEFSPEIFGYSYVHAPSRNRFVLMDRGSSAILYPVNNPVYVVQYVRSESQHLPEKNSIPDPSSIVPLTAEQKDEVAKRTLQRILKPFLQIVRE